MGKTRVSASASPVVADSTEWPAKLGRESLQIRNNTYDGRRPPWEYDPDSSWPTTRRRLLAVAGTVGVASFAGCAACGSAVLAGLLSLFGVAGAGTLLPLDGLEFSLLALVALVLSIYWVAEGMRGGEIRGCPV